MSQEFKVTIELLIAQKLAEQKAELLADAEMQRKALMEQAEAIDWRNRRRSVLLSILFYVGGLGTKYIATLLGITLPGLRNFVSSRKLEISVWLPGP